MSGYSFISIFRSKFRGGVEVGRGGKEFVIWNFFCKLNISYFLCSFVVIEGRKNVLVINW